MQLLVDIGNVAVEVGLDYLNSFLLRRIIELLEFVIEINKTPQPSWQPLYQFLRKRLFGYGAGEARQTKSCAACFVSGQSSAEAGTQPSGYERSKRFQQHKLMVE